jgi:O-antigen/teichoic acid export membrane protein
VACLLILLASCVAAAWGLHEGFPSAITIPAVTLVLILVLSLILLPWSSLRQMDEHFRFADCIQMINAPYDAVTAITPGLLLVSVHVRHRFGGSIADFSLYRRHREFEPFIAKLVELGIIDSEDVLQ